MKDERVLYLVRHGSAGEPNGEGKRELTEEGRAEVTALREALEQKGVRIDRIFHSEKLRAEQTAEVLASLCETAPTSRSGLAPEDDPDVFVAEIGELGGSTMIVSHLPFLPNLCDELLEDMTPLTQFRTATAVCLRPVGENRGRGDWRLAWQVHGRDEMGRNDER
ncbi:MAG: phosphohistidine phosphatase SixA [Thermoanaerobaculia bacterium]|nr:phosphohistidine phosphatase SixA [Thermoanaerobaculia bacterium]